MLKLWILYFIKQRQNQIQQNKSSPWPSHTGTEIKSIIWIITFQSLWYLQRAGQIAGFAGVPMTSLPVQLEVPDCLERLAVKNRFRVGNAYRAKCAFPSIKRHISGGQLFHSSGVHTISTQIRAQCILEHVPLCCPHRKLLVFPWSMEWL